MRLFSRCRAGEGQVDGEGQGDRDTGGSASAGDLESSDYDFGEYSNGFRAQ